MTIVRLAAKKSKTSPKINLSINKQKNTQKCYFNGLFKRTLSILFNFLVIPVGGPILIS